MTFAVSRHHIVVHDRDMSVHCLGCNQKLEIKLPCDIDVWMAAATTFGIKHANCAPPADPCVAL